MRARSFLFASSSAAVIALLVLASAPASAQYFDYTPQPPDVEVDLSVLDDGRPTPAAPAVRLALPIESVPLPPLNAEGFMPPVSRVSPSSIAATPAAPVPSPYERERVIQRIELDDMTPNRAAAPSPFNPPAVITPPKPAPETARTAPAVVVKPRPLSPLDGGDPVLVTAETAGTREMPALNVSRDVKGEKPVPAAKPRAVIKPPAETADNGPALLPQRKPADLSPYEATVEAPRQTAPVTVLDVPPPPPAMPAGVRDAESVIDDLNSAEADAGNDQLAALPGMVEETVPRDAETPRAVHGDDAGKSAGLLIFDGDDTVIDDAMRDTLQGVARTLKKENGSRLLIRAYASGPDGSKAAARRVSLSRALAVRSFLMDEGLEPSRVDVRALGRDTDVSPADRVDLVLNGQ